VGLLRSKLKEFQNLKQGNHTVYDYTRQFNTLAQYGTYHVNTDEKKANLYSEGLTIHLQECLVQLSSLSYNELASAAIDQERMMKDVVEADEKKRKRMTHRPSGRDGSSGVPPKYHMVYTPPGVHCANLNSSSSSCNNNSSNSTTVCFPHSCNK
jgi:hypothetical protein